MVGQTRPRRRRPPARHRRDARKLESCRKRPGSHSTCHGKRNTYGTTLFGDGARFDRGGGLNLIDTRRSGEAFLSLQALSSSHFVRRKRPFSTKCVWNQQAKARFGFDAQEKDDARL